MSSASRRKFLWLGGSFAAGLLMLPDFSFAAKVARKLEKTLEGKGKAARAKQSPAPSKAKAPVKRTASGKVSRPVTPKASKAAPKKAAGAASAQRSAKPVKRTATAPARKAPVAARPKAVARKPSLELPTSYSPGPSFSFGAGSSQVRDLSLFCVHTGERLEIEYYVDGNYEPDALRAVDRLLRDYHTDEICQFDPRVLNQLHDLRRALGSREPFHVYSGYRSPATNESYRRAGGRVAEHSYHLTGQAIDVSLPGRDVRQLRNVAIAMRSGGVGYYPSDGFLHIDSGPVRRW